MKNVAFPAPEPWGPRRGALGSLGGPLRAWGGPWGVLGLGPWGPRSGGPW